MVTLVELVMTFQIKDELMNKDASRLAKVELMLPQLEPPPPLLLLMRLCHRSLILYGVVE